MGFRWRVFFDTVTSNFDCAIKRVSVMGFFEWAVLFLLCLINEKFDTPSEFLPFEWLWFAIYAISALMTSMIGCYELVLWGKSLL